ncbi:hypothetical protein AC579_7511 [Pseudocercospora musae]|uniref:Uncharacterized protein n=1 Tax=Pseudocercospora musae TaxID=113226 RepID=A0A139IBL0_9PEZI|nr:hypothetical protein AC579_7511 [Pseudocercospora musae]
MKIENAVSSANKGSKVDMKRKRSIKSGADEALKQDAAGEDEDDVETGFLHHHALPAKLNGRWPNDHVTMWMSDEYKLLCLRYACRLRKCINVTHDDSRGRTRWHEYAE